MEGKTFGIQLIRSSYPSHLYSSTRSPFSQRFPATRIRLSVTARLVSMQLNSAAMLILQWKIQIGRKSFPLLNRYKKFVCNARSGPVGRKTAAIRGSLSHYHLNSPPLTGTAKSASFSGKKHRRKRHSALCCGHYLFRGIVKAVVIGGRGGEGEREGETAEGGGVSGGEAHARAEGLAAPTAAAVVDSRHRRAAVPTSSLFSALARFPTSPASTLITRLSKGFTLSFFFPVRASHAQRRARRVRLNLHPRLA